jgi:hypothetical protein
MSFTLGTLLYHESLIIAGLYEELGDWTGVREKVIRDNRLQMRTRNASERICQKAISQLKLLCGSFKLQSREILHNSSLWN